MLEISVIVPVYKTELYLDECIASILAQTHTAFELLLIDDGSPDSCPEMCDLWAKQDNRIRVFHQKNSGPGKAIANGIALAKYNYISFVDSDDWLHCTFLETLALGVQKYNADIVQCGALLNGQKIREDLTSELEYIFDNPRQKLLVPFFEETASLFPLTNSRWNKIYRKEILLDAISKISNYPTIGEDLLLNLQYLLLCNTVVVLKGNNNYYYRQRSNSLSSAYNRTKRIAFSMLFLEIKLIGEKNKFTCNSLDYNEQRNIVHLMLDAILSSLSIPEKVLELKILRNSLHDYNSLIDVANRQVFYGRIALHALWLKQYRFTCLAVAVFLKFSKRNTNE